MNDKKEQPEEILSEQQKRTLLSEEEIHEYPTYLSNEQLES